MGNKICAAVFIALLGTSPALAQSTLIKQATNQFLSAQKAEAALRDKPPSERTRTQYLQVIRSYERVYLITPATGYADNALAAIAKLYEEIKDPKNAIKTLQFLVSDYPQSSMRAAAEQDIARLNKPLNKPLNNPLTPAAASTAVTTQQASKPAAASASPSAPAAPSQPAARPVSAPAPAAVTPTPAGDAGSKSAILESVRYYPSENAVRIVVDLTAGVTFKKGDAKSPPRTFLDITPARLSRPLTGKEWTVDSGTFQKIRVAQYTDTTVRLVLDGAATQRVNAFTLTDPNRLVVDVSGIDNPSPVIMAADTAPKPPAASTPAAGAAVGSAAAAAPVPATPVPAGATISAAAAPPAPTASTATKTAAPAKPADRADQTLMRSLGLKLSRVVVDAGHGGHDTGSIGPTGLTEKELALDIANRLRTLIETELSVEVVMTRPDDTFVPLETRTKIANQQAADLFISIHANSSSTKTARGVETFFLNLNMESREALATASRENATSQLTIHDQNDLLRKIMMNDKLDESREFAQHVQTAMSKRKDAGPDRGVKQAPFVVLIGANMPSILAEVSFISNPDEEKLLKTPQYRQQIAESLFQGVKSYSDTLSGIKTAKSQEKN